MSDILQHHGILGQKWGKSNGPPYPLGASDHSASEKKAGWRQSLSTKRAEKKDAKWAKRHYNRIYNRAYKGSKKEMDAFVKKELNTLYRRELKSGKVSRSYAIAYNRKMADLMNQQISGLTAPSGKVIQFVAKRGEIGVHMALADSGYNMNQLKNGVYSSGKIAYKKQNVNMT